MPRDTAYTSDDMQRVLAKFIRKEVAQRKYHDPAKAQATVKKSATAALDTSASQKFESLVDGKRSYVSRSLERNTMLSQHQMLKCCIRMLLFFSMLRRCQKVGSLKLHIHFLLLFHLPVNLTGGSQERLKKQATRQPGRQPSRLQQCTPTSHSCQQR